VDVDAENSVSSSTSALLVQSVVPSPSRLDSQVTHEHPHHLADVHSVVSPDTAVDTLTKCDNTEPNSPAESAAEIEVSSTHHAAVADEACANLDEATALKWRSCGGTELSTVTVAITSPPTHTDTPLAAADEACMNLDEPTVLLVRSCMDTVPVVCEMPSAADAEGSDCVVEATATQTDTVNLHHHCTAAPTNEATLVVTVDANPLFSPEAHHQNVCDDSGVYFDVGEGVTPSRAVRDCDVRGEDEDKISVTRTTMSATELASLPPVSHFTHTPSVVAPPSAASAARAAAVLAVADAFRLADRVLILAGAGFSAGSLCADGTKLPGKREGARPAS